MSGPVNTGLKMSSYFYGDQPVPMETLRASPAFLQGWGSMEWFSLLCSLLS